MIPQRSERKKHTHRHIHIMRRQLLGGSSYVSFSRTNARFRRFSLDSWNSSRDISRKEGRGMEGGRRERERTNSNKKWSQMNGRRKERKWEKNEKLSLRSLLPAVFFPLTHSHSLYFLPGLFSWLAGWLAGLVVKLSNGNSKRRGRRTWSIVLSVCLSPCEDSAEKVTTSDRDGLSRIAILLCFLHTFDLPEHSFNMYVQGIYTTYLKALCSFFICAAAGPNERSMLLAFYGLLYANGPWMLDVQNGRRCCLRLHIEFLLMRKTFLKWILLPVWSASFIR